MAKEIPYYHFRVSKNSKGMDVSRLSNLESHVDNNSFFFIISGLPKSVGVICDLLSIGVKDNSPHTCPP
jgi:hypothetical protein